MPLLSIRSTIPNVNVLKTNCRAPVSVIKCCEQAPRPKVPVLLSAENLQVGTFHDYKCPKTSILSDEISIPALTQQVSDGCVDVSHVLGQQRRPVCVAVVFHQALVQQQLTVGQGTLGERRDLTALVDRGGPWGQKCRFLNSGILMLTIKP